jgi:hypothetical protein
MSLAYSVQVEWPLHPAIPNILLERVLFADYKLQSMEDRKQVFRLATRLGAVLFWVGGGKWEESPTRLTIKYLPLPDRMRVHLLWELIHVADLNEQEKAGYKAWVDAQFNDFRTYVQQWLDAAGVLPGSQ